MFNFYHNLKYTRSSHCGSGVTNPTGIQEDAGLVLALLSGLRIQHCCEAVVEAADTAWMLHCCGCGEGQQPQLLLDLQSGNFHMPQEQP